MSSGSDTSQNPEEWEVVIPYDLVSPNKLMRMHYRARLKEFDRVRDLLWYYGRPLPEFTVPVKLQITRQWGKRQRAMDLDNLYGSCKHLIDALKRPKGRSRKGLSVILDDDPSHIFLTVDQIKDENGLRQVRVKITPDQK
jgi:hypothetical protein|tara:strand:+ start:195 stop:614 length:420 start_codon:yes stop_codon:yes gene_type:complete